nr:HEAT repeat domain-containing protein [Leptolyngbyaceae cyanobacterium MO_188.B28]
EQKSHWLIHLSIFAAMEDLDCPEVLLDMCRQGFNGEDLTVRLIAVSSLSKLQGTPQAEEALEILLQAAENEDPQIRATAAKVLRQFGGEPVQAVLATLRQDPDHQVVAAVLEGLL